MIAAKDTTACAPHSAPLSRPSHLLACFAWLLALYGCVEEGPLPSDQGSPAKIEQAQCNPETSCQIGTQSCDHEGNVVLCVDDGSGCGVPGQVVNHCGDDFWCFQGGCTWVDSEPVPGQLSSSAPSLFELDGVPEALPAGVTVIPYSAFANALRYDSYFEEASPGLIRQAAEITATGNKPETWGVTFDLDATSQEFSGDLFLVVRDAKRSAAHPELMEATRYFVAAMPGLAGEAKLAGHKRDLRKVAFFWSDRVLHQHVFEPKAR